MKFLNYKFNYNKIKTKGVNNVNINYKNMYTSYISFNAYSFMHKNNLILLNPINIKNNNMVNKINLKNNLISYNIIKGIQEKDLIVFFNTFSKIYDLFYNNNDLVNSLGYKYSKEFLYNFFKYTSYNNSVFILN